MSPNILCFVLAREYSYGMHLTLKERNRKQILNCFNCKCYIFLYKTIFVYFMMIVNKLSFVVLNLLFHRFTSILHFYIFGTICSVCDLHCLHITLFLAKLLVVFCCMNLHYFTIIFKNDHLLIFHHKHKVIQKKMVTILLWSNDN